MSRNRLVGACTALAVTVGGTAIVATAGASAAGLTGAGSTLVAPLMANWINGFEIKQGIPVKYASVDSDQGIKQVIGRTVDLGVSDAPLTPEQAAACNGCVQIPLALSAVGIGYNLPGVAKNKLNLNGPILAMIYRAKITNWNDPRIAKLNPGLKLPALPITPVFRSDGSGTTYAFARYLSKISRAWRREVGYGTTVRFPAGTGGKGDADVTSMVARTPGAVGYIDASYLIAAGVSVAAIENNARRFTYPNLSNIEEAGAAVRGIPANNEINIPALPKRPSSAYPISMFSYAIVPQDAPQLLFDQQFLEYCVTIGQQYGAVLDFAPLPKLVRRAALRSIASL